MQKYIPYYRDFLNVKHDIALIVEGFNRGKYFAQVDLLCSDELKRT
jgi:hypothetical protein